VSTSYLVGALLRRLVSPIGWCLHLIELVSVEEIGVSNRLVPTYY
jgi:hypothetical protein